MSVEELIMRNLARSLAALLLGALSVLAAGLPASAQVDGCQRQETGYGASGVCVVTVAQADAVCVNGVLQLTYRVIAEGTDATTVDLHWRGPAGSEVVLAAQPLAGTVTWPASIARVATDVRFVANPEATVRVDPAAANAACATPTSKVLSVSDEAPTRSSRVLAFTGAEVLPLVAVGAALLLAGAGVLVARAARQRRAGQ